MKSKFSSKIINGTLKIYEEKIWHWNNNQAGYITLYIPEDMNLKEIDIDNGAGRVVIDSINVREIDLDHGAGAIEIVNSKFDKADINGGAGKIEIKSSVLNNVELSAGVGRVSIEAEITGDSKIECGVGGVDVVLNGEKEDYKIVAEKGIGSLKIEGKSISDEHTYGVGRNRIRVEGGVGSINIDFDD
ncbi:MAG: DUF4097 domain-containing protein [Clostridia bacterium]|nr:DUF4097 domain-containing protein [Clostridia bacterium]